MGGDGPKCGFILMSKSIKLFLGGGGFKAQPYNEMKSIQKFRLLKCLSWVMWNVLAKRLDHVMFKVLASISW